MRTSKILFFALAALAVGTLAASSPSVLARGGGGGGGGGGHGGGGGGGGSKGGGGGSNRNGGKSGRAMSGSKASKTTHKDIEIAREKLRQIDYRDHDSGTDRGPV